MSIRRNTDYLFIVIITFGIAYMVAVIVGRVQAKQYSEDFMSGYEKTRKVTDIVYGRSTLKQ